MNFKLPNLPKLKVSRSRNKIAVTSPEKQTNEFEFKFQVFASRQDRKTDSVSQIRPHSRI